MATASKQRALQSHGLNSKVYGPILLHIFNARWRKGAATVLFTLDDIRNAADSLKLEVRNPADLIYRMRSRTVLPKEVLDKGFFILRAIGRGRYQFEKGSSTIFQPLNSEPTAALDITPLPVRRLLPENLAEMDEQAILTIASYCKLFDHFTGLQVYRLRSHVRKSVPGIGQAELDAIDVGVALRDDETPILFPIEPKLPPTRLTASKFSTCCNTPITIFPSWSFARWRSRSTTIPFFTSWNSTMHAKLPI